MDWYGEIIVSSWGYDLGDVSICRNADKTG